jgi:hypothetical protein
MNTRACVCSPRTHEPRGGHLHLHCATLTLGPSPTTSSPQAHHKLTTSSLRATGSPSPIHTSTLGYSNYTLNAPPSTTRRSSISNLPKFLLSLQKFFHNYFHSNDLIQVLINQTVKLEEQGGAHGEAADAYACGC